MEIHRAQKVLCPLCQVETGAQNPMKPIFAIDEKDVSSPIITSEQDLIALFKKSQLAEIYHCEYHGLVDTSSGHSIAKRKEPQGPVRDMASFPTKEELATNEILPMPNLSKIRELQERPAETDLEKLRQTANKYLPFRGN